MSAVQNTLPARPNLEFLRKLAKDRLAQSRASDPGAKLHQSQLAVAREHGFSSWRALVAHLTPTSAGSKLVKHGSRTEIAGIPRLSWQRDTTVTFVGALAGALKAFGAGSAGHDVPTLMGDSALGFRMRWWSADDFSRSCPSGPVGEFQPWTNLAADSIGWSLRWEVDLHDGSSDDPDVPPKTPADPQDMNGYQSEVLAHLDAGRPVLAYIKGWDLGILYGYDSGPTPPTLLASDYFLGDSADNTVTFDSLRGLLCFFEENHPAPARPTSIARALRQAGGDWTGPRQPSRRHNRDGAYYLGEGAYARWADTLRETVAHPERFDEEAMRNLLHVHHWTFVSLCAAREQVAGYLRSARTYLPPAAHTHLDSAAKAADDLMAQLSTLRQDLKLFPPFYLPDALAKFPPAVRKDCLPALEKLARLDGALHERVQRVVAAL